MKPPPTGWPRISSALFYEDPRAAIDWLCDVFGFRVQIKVEGDDGSLHHSELVLGGGLVMVGDANRRSPRETGHRRSPKRLDGANTQSLMVFVDDVDAHCAHAKSKGATIAWEPETHDYGVDYWVDRSYECIDLEGHRWWFTSRLVTGGKPAG